MFPKWTNRLRAKAGAETAGLSNAGTLQPEGDHFNATNRDGAGSRGAARRRPG